MATAHLPPFRQGLLGERYITYLIFMSKADKVYNVPTLTLQLVPTPLVTGSIPRKHVD